ncbi:GNAT family N-acetyltransferase [Magnetospirillum sp. 64-120]|uniref:GNAT family N-acetyltransferase n=1 Tax=Magnetospirillum sp. 64-120 TaxID=1895778 RepID=UPI0009287A8A|nr:GNAT family N-acetyltransferase [Magnetospirillum sp. 64-120]OJX81295.1 MAG: hypothetical protein BGO92_09640 [Magnetospirillum sp. 64-120]
MIHWRPMTPGDLARVLEIANTLHPDYPERIEIFADKLAFDPDGCRVLADGDKVVGYGFAHGWTLGLPPLLDAELGAPPGPTDCLHLHDVAIMPQARGGGRVGLYLDHLESLASRRRLDWLGLIAITGKDGYWKAKGFTAMTTPGAGLSQRLASYGDGNHYLIRHLTKLKESDTQIA